jgi:hypothetical protein
MFYQTFALATSFYSQVRVRGEDGLGCSKHPGHGGKVGGFGGSKTEVGWKRSETTERNRKVEIWREGKMVNRDGEIERKGKAKIKSERHRK